MYIIWWWSPATPHRRVHFNITGPRYFDKLPALFFEAQPTKIAGHTNSDNLTLHLYRSPQLSSKDNPALSILVKGTTRYGQNFISSLFRYPTTTQHRNKKVCLAYTSHKLILASQGKTFCNTNNVGPRFNAKTNTVKIGLWLEPPLPRWHACVPQRDEKCCIRETQTCRMETFALWWEIDARLTTDKLCSCRESSHLWSCGESFLWAGSAFLTCA
jgi:hypothetical protein